MCVALRQFRAHYETRWKPRAFVTFPTRGRFFGTKRPWTTQDSQAASGSRILTSCMPRSNMFRTTDTPRIMKVCTTNPATNTLALYPNTGVGTEPASGTKVGLYTPEKKKKTMLPDAPLGPASGRDDHVCIQQTGQSTKNVASGLPLSSAIVPQPRRQCPRH